MRTKNSRIIVLATIRNITNGNAILISTRRGIPHRINTAQKWTWTKLLPTVTCPRQTYPWACPLWNACSQTPNQAIWKKCSTHAMEIWCLPRRHWAASSRIQTITSSSSSNICCHWPTRQQVCHRNRSTQAIHLTILLTNQVSCLLWIAIHIIIVSLAPRQLPSISTISISIAGLIRPFQILIKQI